MTAGALSGALVFLAFLALRAIRYRAERWLVLGGPGGATPRLTAPRRLAEALAAGAVPVAPSDAWTVWLLAAAAGGAGAFLAGGAGLAVVALLALVLGPVLLLAAVRDRSARQVDAALPEALEGVARSLRSGATLQQAVGEASRVEAGRLGDDLRIVVADAEGGSGLVAALEAWPSRCPTSGVRLATAALALSAEAGGAAAKAVDGVAATLRSNLAVAGEVRAQSSQARLSGLVIALSPLAFGALAAGTDQRTAAFLLHSPFGLVCLTVGLGLDALGGWWMHRITAVAA